VFKHSILKRKKKHLNEEMSLNITSMADVFTIILVFLLKSFSTGAQAVTPSAGMVLPMAGAENPAMEALKVHVAADSISIEGNPVLTLEGFQVPNQEKQSNGASRSLAPHLSSTRPTQSP
jgi:biopolymer transport protein ExbD